MKTLAVLLLVASSLTAAPAVKWETSLKVAQRRAKANNQLIFLDVWTGWCTWCIKLKQDTFPTDAAQEALAKVVPLSIETQDKAGASLGPDAKALEEKYKVEAYPTMLILDPQGAVVAKFEGYKDPEAFAKWVNASLQSRKK
jgi:thioredoxin-related protein